MAPAGAGPTNHTKLEIHLQPQLRLRARELDEVQRVRVAAGAAGELLRPGAGEVDLFGDLIMERRSEKQRGSSPGPRGEAVELAQRVRLGADHRVGRQAPGERCARAQRRVASPRLAV